MHGERHRRRAVGPGHSTKTRGVMVASTYKDEDMTTLRVGEAEENFGLAFQ